MAVFITNWNPDKWEMPAEDIAAAIGATARRGVWAERWSLGNRRSGIVPGDTAVMMRQRDHRGLVASGTFISGVYLDRHWADPSQEAPYADIEWEVWLPLEDALDVDRLAQEVPGVNWNRLQASGVRVDAPCARVLLDLWDTHLASAGRTRRRSADELVGTFPEGAALAVTVNRYERDPLARQACIERWGLRCTVCNLSFEERYGVIGAGFINVHHVMDLALLGDAQVDPVRDLRPVCPNCHAMLHTRRPAMSIDDLRAQLLA